MDPSVKTPGEYSRHLKILRQLRAAGLSQDVELPCICVVGVQSAGKSSVIEAMSTLKLPRGVGTCTKCPMEFYTECSDAPLSVDISLCYGSNDVGGSGSGTKEVPFKKNLTDVNQVEHEIAEAQKRILEYGPDGKPLATLGTALPTFTKDCVRISAKGPDMDNLYFYDIPGVITRVKDGQDRKEIDLIHDLVKKYVSKPNCIVLQVMSCEADFETGGVDTDPEVRARTVGVLTKADKVDTDSWEHRLMTFNNQHYRLDMGWFAVSNRADGSWKAARERENEFFRDSEFWGAIPEADKARLGSQNLTRFISGLLSKRVAESLPLISRKLGDNIDIKDKELRGLRTRTEPEAQSEIITILGNFSTRLSKHIEGIRPKFLTKEVGLVYEANRVYESIREEISRRTPRFSLDDAPSGGGDAVPGPQTSTLSHISASGNILYLDQIAEYIGLSELRELPGELPYGLAQEIITELVGNWESAAMSGFRDVEAIAKKHLNVLVHTHFAEYQRGGLFSDIKKILDANTSKCADKTKDEIAEMAARELAPYTVLRAEFITLQTTLERDYRRQLEGRQSSTTPLGDLFGAFMLANREILGGDLAAGVISAATKAALHAFSNRHPAPTVPDATDTKSLNRSFALKVMSRTQAYLELASKRFAEVTVKCIDHGFLRKLDHLVQNAVRAMPINTSPQMCLAVLQDPTTLQQRRSAEERKEHYIRIKTIVDAARQELEVHVAGQPSSEMGSMMISDVDSVEDMSGSSVNSATSSVTEES